MAEAERMSLVERLKYLRLIQPRYRQVSRRERGALLDEAERVTHRHRKTLIRRLNGDLGRKRRSRQRGRSYGPEVESAVRLIARSLDFPCGERLQPALMPIAQALANHGELVLSPGLLERLGRISLSTAGRMVQRMRRDGHLPRLARGRPSRPNPLTRHIPAGRLPRDLPQPGHFEVDLVHHCGHTPSGQYVHTLQLIDIATGWSERVAILGRSYTVMQDAFTRLLARLPFPIRELHPDNGGEFFNHFLLTYWKEVVPGLTLSRTRPFRKNDNPFVEEKNGSLVRGYLGFARLDTVAQTNLLNQIYDRMWLLHNFFHPVMRQQPAPAARPGNGLSRSYDRPQPAFDRLCAATALDPQREPTLAELRSTTNPLQLRNEVHTLLDRISRLPNARAGRPQDIRRTLFHHPDQTAPVTLSIEGSFTAR
ncbi:MAG: integrase [Anaerolineales bacterium]